MRKQYFYDKCNRCGDLKKSTTNSFCSKCRTAIKNRQMSSLIVNKSTFEQQKNEIIEFVNRIEARGGWASTREILSELITYYKYLVNDFKLDALKPSEQVMIMYDRLRTQVKKWNALNNI